MYRIVRNYADDSVSKETIKENLSLEEAQAHCRDPETSSSTCKRPENIRLTKLFGPWFDDYEEM